jgi:alkylation response protein AidB-like acyl-CoA dehydrogenase
VQATRLARVCLEESMKYAFKRETFGKPLIEHPVIRLKLAHMARQVESTQAWLESITYQVINTLIYFPFIYSFAHRIVVWLLV